MRTKQKCGTILVLTLIFAACSKNSSEDTATLAALVTSNAATQGCIGTDCVRSGAATRDSNSAAISTNNILPDFPDESAYYVFVTDEHNGDWKAYFDANGIVGADAYCNSHMPDSLRYGRTGEFLPISFKAMLVDESRRRASVTANQGDGQTNWVFKPNTQYRRATDGQLIATTDSKGLIPFPMVNSFTSNPHNNNIWTGLNSDWTTVPQGSRCNDWTSTTGMGRNGYANLTSNNAISVRDIGCGNETAGIDQKIGILCVAQWPVVPRNFKYLYQVAGTDGDLSFQGKPGLYGADKLCNTETFYNSHELSLLRGKTKPFKAMVVDGINRRASVTANQGDGQIDWVLKPNTEYRRTLTNWGSLVGVTNSAGLF
uniref:endostatin-like outer membrane lipoprotein, LenD-like n=1 Tax=Leptospira santarosai TaxID=28183 RepID=UPI000773509F